MVQSTLLLFLAVSCTLQVASAIELFIATFRNSTEGFTYRDNVFSNATQNGYSFGRHKTTNGGDLIIQLGGVNNRAVKDMSGGWIKDFTLPNLSNVVIDVRYSMNVSSAYEFDEYNQVLCSVDGRLFGRNSSVKYVEEIYGSGTGGRTGVGDPPIIVRWKWVKIPVDTLSAGTHRLILGAYNNKKSYFNEESQIIVSDINLHYIPVSAPTRPNTKTPTIAPIKNSPVLQPMNGLTTAPSTKAPLHLPVKTPVIRPSRAITKSPVQPPIPPPSAAPTNAPIHVPTTAPVIKVPVKVPRKVPVKTPVKSPIAAITNSPVQLLFPTLIAAPIPVATPTTDLNTIRINAGSDTNYVAPNGDVWIPDTNFRTNGQIFNVCPFDINGTDLEELYCKERFYNMWLDPTAKFQYIIPVNKTGTYLVNLHFAETYYNTSKQRIFDILVDGKKVVKGLDIYSKAGFATALVIPITTQITVPKIVIELVGKVENPKISGIEVIEMASTISIPTAAPVAQPIEILINCGGSGFDELYSDRTWDADQYYTGGLPYNDGSSDILNTVDDQLYQTERYGEFRYDIPVPQKGQYTIILHFAELYWPKVGERLFNIYIEKDIRVLNFDILALSNSTRYQAVTFEWNNVTVMDQFVSIALTNSNPQMDHPKLSGIEILGQ